jgi:ubiquinone/menaquinone biosynthesis C-methylase UbiE
MSLSSRDEVRELYRNSAASYDQMMEQEIKLPIYHEVLSNLAWNLKNTEGSILDSSCGTGHMLERIRDDYAPNRELVGVDISPKMVEIARKRLGRSAILIEGDMSAVPQIPNESCAAVLSFYAIQHVEIEELHHCLDEWKRILVLGGQLLLAAWEGEGAIDYGGVSEVVARRYREKELVSSISIAGFDVVHSAVKPVDDFDMDAVHILATKPIEKKS